MYHPLLLQTDVLRDLPALLDDLRPRVAERAVLTYRSEAFAEDLFGSDEATVAPVAPARRAALAPLLLALAPLCMALAGAGAVVAGVA